MLQVTSVEKFVWAFLGSFLALRIYDHIQEALEEEKIDLGVQTLEVTAEDNIRLEDLAALAKSENLTIRAAALQIIYDRAISEPHISYILTGLESQDIETRRNSLIAIQALVSHNSKNGSMLVKRKVLKLIVRSMHFSSNEDVDKQAVSALYSLIFDNDKRKHKVCAYHVVERLNEFLLREPLKFSGLKEKSIQMIHQLTATEQAIKYLSEAGIVYTLLKMLRLTYGNLEMQRICVFSIVRILSSIEDEYCVPIIEKMIEMNVISLASGCLRRTHPELTCWTIWLLQLFVSRNMQVEEISKIKGLVSLLSQYIKPGDSITSNSVLRMLRSICDYKHSFYKDLLKAKILPQLFKCVSGSEDQTQHTALSLVHTIAYRMNNHKMFFDANGLEAILVVASSKYYQTHLYLVEIIGILCSDPLNIPRLEARTTVIDVLIRFSFETNLELRQSSLTVLANLVAVSELYRRHALNQNAFLQFSHLMNNRNTPQIIRPRIAKLLVCLVGSDIETRIQFHLEAVIPCLSLLYLQMEECLALEKEKQTDVTTPFGLAYMSTPATNGSLAMTPSDIETPASPTSTQFPDVESPTIPRKLSDLAYIWKFSMETMAILFDLNLSLIGDAEENENFNQLVVVRQFELYQIILSSFDFVTETKESTDFRIEVGVAALKLLSSILHNEYLVEKLPCTEIFTSMITMLNVNDDRITRNVVMTSYDLSRHRVAKYVISDVPEIFKCIYRAVSITRDEDLWPFLNDFATNSFDWAVEYQNPNFVNLENPLTTNAINVFRDSLEINNRSWNFETVVGSHGVSGNGKFAYEFQLGTVGIIQLGWCSNNSSFNPRSGYGVGDDLNSYAFDGTRVRRWHGRDVGVEDYGESWAPHDIVTALIDLDNQTISFMLNGSDLGIAFDDIDVTKVWYPAVSLTSDQFGNFRFGGPLDKLYFNPPEFSPIPLEMEEFYSVQSLQSLAGGESVAGGVQNSEEYLDITPTLLAKPDHEPLTSISMYFEVQIQLNRNLSNVLQIGYLTKSKSLCVACYHPVLKQVFFILTSRESEDSFFDTELPILLSEQEYCSIPWSNEELDVKILGRSYCSIQDSSVLGVGISDEEGNCFFTHDGIIIGPRIPLDDFEVVPYFRNIHRLIFNFGKHDYMFQDGNTCFSPTVIAIK